MKLMDSKKHLNFFSDNCVETNSCTTLDATSVKNQSTSPQPPTTPEKDQFGYNTNNTSEEPTLNVSRHSSFLNCDFFIYEYSF